MKKQNNKKILIVDDFELNRAILCEMFCRDYEVIEAEGGRQAIEILKKEGTNIKALLLDIVMPDIDGFGVLDFLSEQNMIEKLPVFLITAETAVDTIMRGFEKGVVDVINKPINDPAIICKRVYNAIELYQKRSNLECLVEEQVQTIRKQNENLQTTKTSIIDMLSSVIEFRSGESGEHVRRIRKATKILLENMAEICPEYNLSEEWIILVSGAATMHDIGKVSVPDYILNKPGRLTKEEFDEMKKHTIYGSDMLKSIPFFTEDPIFQHAYEICRHHHERWDGKGYPDGLKGDEIPLSAQVVSLADVYDALVSDRVYRKALSHEKALSMIANGECGAFNPQLLESFFAVADILHEQLYAHPEVQEEEDIIKEKPVMSAIKPQEESNLSVRTLQLLERERKRYRCLSQMSGEILFDYDRETDTIEYTDRYCEIFGGTNVVLHAADAMKKSEHIDDADRRRIYAELEKLSPENPTLRSEVKLMTKYGSEEWFEIVLKAIFDEKEEYCDYIGKITNINRLKSESLHWKKQAFQDYLTGLYNQPALEDWMERQILQKPDAPFGLMILDIDYFKKVNDTGHENGDQLLKDTSGFLLHHLRSSDVVARIGGDEFAVIMQGVCSEEILNCKAVQIQNDFTSEFSAKYNANLSLSVGAVCYPEQGATYHELMMKADQVLLQAKQNREPR